MKLPLSFVKYISLFIKMMITIIFIIVIIMISLTIIIIIIIIFFFWSVSLNKTYPFFLTDQKINLVLRLDDHAYIVGLLEHFVITISVVRNRFSYYGCYYLLEASEREADHTPTHWAFKNPTLV